MFDLAFKRDGDLFGRTNSGEGTILGFNNVTVTSAEYMGLVGGQGGSYHDMAVRSWVDSGVLGDVDSDGDVNLVDHQLLEHCLTGPGQPLTATCSPSTNGRDLDNDNDCDLADYALFTTAFGSGN